LDWICCPNALHALHGLTGWIFLFYVFASNVAFVNRRQSWAQLAHEKRASLKIVKS
jgi:hypothetical protein